MSARKEKRVLSKVKKVRAFLNVVRLNEKDKEMKLECKKRSAEGEVFPEEDSSKKSKMNEDNVIDVERDITSLPFQELTEEERTKLIQMRRQAKQAAMEKPKIYLTLKQLGEEVKKRLSKTNQNTDECEIERLPTLYTLDLQALILYAIEGATASLSPRWCKLLRPNKVKGIVVMVIDGISLSDVNNNTDSFDYLTSHFTQYVEMTSPYSYNSTIENDVFNVPLSQSQWSNKFRSYASQAKGKNDDVPTDHNKLSDMVPQDTEDKFDRRLLLLNLKDMLHDGYPLPIAKFNDSCYKYFMFTKESYEPVTAKSPIFAIDCEMCRSKIGRELSRISIVNEKCEVLLDRLVKPRHVIIDYATRFSGITEEMLRNVKTSLFDVQKEVRKILPPDAILVGHSLENDLIAMKMFHPYCIDTSVIYNLGKKEYKSGLSTLTRHFLKKDIQLDLNGHSPVEDAVATMELTLLKLRTGIEFGDVLSGCNATFDTINNILPPSVTEHSTSNLLIKPTKENLYQSLFHILYRVEKSSVIISSKEILDKNCGNPERITCTDDDQGVQQAKQSITDHKHFIWLNLQDCLNDISKLKSVPYRKEKFESLDKSIKELVECCQPGTLFITVVSGKVRKKKTESSGVYVCIT